MPILVSSRDLTQITYPDLFMGVPPLGGSYTLQRNLPGATRISCFFERTLRNVKSFWKKTPSYYNNIEKIETGNVAFTTDNIYKQSYIVQCTIDASFTQ